MRIASIIVAGALAAPAILRAGDVTQSTSGFYVTPQVNAVRTDEDRAVDDGAAATLAAGFELNPKWNLESNLFHGRFDGEQADDLKMDALGINALRVFRRRARLSPFLMLGAGALRKDAESGASSTDAYGDAGIGLLLRLRESAADGRALFARFDARARYDDAGSRLDRLFGIGLQYAFGGRTAQPLPPQPAPVAAPPTDNDGDGVVDADDRCPGTPAGKTVGADGCEPDSDHDGVPDSRPDTCQDTPAGTRVDTSGCTLGRAIQLPLVTFENDSDRLESTAFAALDAAIETLRMNADLPIEVAGHTDSRSSDAYNLDLSRRRAETVRRYLVDHGVTNALTSHGYGESEPVADNDTAAGRAKNRRVVLRILSR